MVRSALAPPLPAAAYCAEVADRTVSFRPSPGRSYEVTGSDADAGVLMSIVHHDGRYAEDIAALLEARVPSEGVVVDVGANIGVVTLLLSDLAADGRVIAFEPGADNLRYLRHNLADRGNVEVVAAAAAAEDGALRFDENPDYPAGAHVTTDAGAATRVVPCRSLDSWVRERGLTRVDVVKIDVEGAEPHVLAGAIETIREFRPLVVVECNVGSLRRVAGIGFEELHGQMAALFPTVGMVRPGGTVVPVASSEHLERRLATDGIVDLVGSFDPPGLRSRVRATIDLRRLRRVGSRGAPPDPHNFVVTAPITIEAEGRRRGGPGEVLHLRVRVRNESRWWLSSDFVYHPLHVAGRWSDGAETDRARLPRPVPPGREGAVDLDVRLPETPGEHVLELTLVQEHFAWLCDLDPRGASRVAFVVEERASTD